MCNVFWVVSSADVNRNRALNLRGKTGISNDQSNLNSAAVVSAQRVGSSEKSVDGLSEFAGANTSGGNRKRETSVHMCR